MFGTQSERENTARQVVLFSAAGEARALVLGTRSPMRLAERARLYAEPYKARHLLQDILIIAKLGRKDAPCETSCTRVPIGGPQGPQPERVISHR